MESAMTDDNDAQSGDDPLTDDELAAEEEANEEVAELYNAAPTQVSETAWNVGNRLLQAFHDELTAAGVRQSKDTRFALSRFERRIKTEILAGYREILQGGSPGVQATLAKVVFSAGKVQGALEIDKHTDQTHELADFAGNQVLVILAEDIGQHLADMDATIDELAKLQQELDFEPAEADIGIGTVTERDPDEAKAIDELFHDGEAEYVTTEDGSVVDAEGEVIPPERLIMEDGKVVGVVPEE